MNGVRALEPRVNAFVCLLVTLLHAVVPQASAGSGIPPFDTTLTDTTLAPGGKGKVSFLLGIPEGFHVYRDMLAVKVTAAGALTPGAPIYPPGAVVPDPVNPGQTREEYRDGVAVDIPLTAPTGVAGPQTVAVHVRYQGCKDTLCLMPVEVDLTSTVTVAPSRSGGLFPWIAAARAETPPADEVAVRFSPGPARDDHVVVKVDLEGDWHLNKMFMGVSLPGTADVTLGEPVYPQAHPSGSMDDGTYREDFIADFDLVVPVTGPAGTRTVKVEVAYQACKGVSICRMPTAELVEVPLTLTGAPLPPPPAAPPAAPAAAPEAAAPAAAPEAAAATLAATPASAAGTADTSGFAAAQAQGLWALVLLCFAAGIGVSFTPCVLPMVPITMGMIGARSAGSRAQAMSLTAAYVLGLAIVYTGLGVFAGVTGALFGSWLQSKAVVFAIAGFFVVMGGAMFGWFDVQLPASIAGRLQGGSTRGGYAGAFVVGMIGAIVAGPCSGPVVVSVLALIGQGGQVALGAGLMFAFSLGMGMIFFATGLASGWLPSRGPWMVVVKKAFGIVMWLGAIYYASAHLPTEVTVLATAAVLLATAVFSWPSVEDGEGWFLERLRQLYAVAGGLVGAYLLVGYLVSYGLILPPLQLGTAGATAPAPGIEWLPTESEALAQARATGKPIMIDFTAEWCAACHEMEKLTYTDPRVVAAAEGFVTAMIDCTDEADPIVLEVQKKYGVLGLPTVVFVTADGRLLEKTTGFVEADDFHAVMQRALGAAS